MRYILIWILFANCLYAQNNQAEAIAAFQLAEENYQKGDYNSALQFLEDAKKSFGVANSKMLYLQVNIEYELYKNDASYYDKLIKSITEFNSAPDVKKFNKDKTLEITKLKMQLVSERNKQVAVEKEEFRKKELLANNFKNYSFEGWPVGISLEELAITHKDSILFNRRLKAKKRCLLLE